MEGEYGREGVQHAEPQLRPSFGYACRHFWLPLAKNAFLWYTCSTRHRLVSVVRRHEAAHAVDDGFCTLTTEPCRFRPGILGRVKGSRSYPLGYAIARGSRPRGAL